MTWSVLVPPRKFGRGVLAIAVAAAILMDSAGVQGATKPCVEGKVTARALNKQGDEAFEAGDFLAAARLWDKASGTYPLCRPKQIGRRMEMLKVALEQYGLVSSMVKADAGRCEDPALLAARMLVRHRVELAALASADPTMAPHLAQVEKWLSERDGITVLAGEIHEGLRLPVTQADLTGALSDYKAMVRRFPGCAGPLREHLENTTFLSIPPLKKELSCGADEERARVELHRVLAAIREAEDKGAEAVQSRLDSYNSLGSLVEAAQSSAAEAEAAGSFASAAEFHAQILEALPECAPYHTARAKALVGGIRVLEQIGDRSALEQGIALIDQFRESWRSVADANVIHDPQYVHFGTLRAALATKLAAQPEPHAPEEPPVMPGARRTRNFVPGLAISAGLTTAFVIAATILTARVRRKGPLYMDIVEAYDAAVGLNPYTHADLCNVNTYMGDVGIAKLCARHVLNKNSAITMWTLASVAAVSTGVLGALLGKYGAKRARRRMSLGVAPRRAGVMMFGGFAF